jgi:hypothetical protein
MSIGLTAKECWGIQCELELAKDRMGELVDEIEGVLDKVGCAARDKAKDGWFGVLRGILEAIGDTADEVETLYDPLDPSLFDDGDDEMDA